MEVRLAEESNTGSKAMPLFYSQPDRNYVRGFEKCICCREYFVVNMATGVGKKMHLEVVSEIERPEFVKCRRLFLGKVRSSSIMLGDQKK